jgi:hypothetical protein
LIIEDVVVDPGEEVFEGEEAVTGWQGRKTLHWQETIMMIVETISELEAMV